MATGCFSPNSDIDLMLASVLLGVMLEVEDNPEHWLVVRQDTGEQMGPYAAFDDALQAAEIAGPEWKVVPQT